MMRNTGSTLVLAAIFSVFLSGPSQAAQGESRAAPSKAPYVTSPAARPVAGIKVSFRKEPRKKKRAPGRALWVAPPTFAKIGSVVTLRAVGRDALGQPIMINPTWTADPTMLRISPTQGAQVTLTALAAGESDLVVTFRNVTKKLSVKAAGKNGVAKIAISQDGARKANPPPPSDIAVLFKLDPRVTRGLYMGERWISRPSYTMHAHATMSVRVAGITRHGEGISINPTWSGDPEMVSITPARGPKVDITVLKEGRSDVVVNTHDITRKLTVTAANNKGVWRVTISTRPPPTGR